MKVGDGAILVRKSGILIVKVGFDSEGGRERKGRCISVKLEAAMDKILSTDQE